jgi:hypothetical protein
MFLWLHGQKVGLDERQMQQDEPPKMIRGWIELEVDRVSRPKSSWQQLRVISHLAQMYPNGVPADVQRKWLLRELGRRDPALARLDLKTLRRAIRTYNASRGCGGGD